MRSVTFARSERVNWSPTISSSHCSVLPSSPRRFRSSASNFASSASRSMLWSAIRSFFFPLIPVNVLSTLLMALSSSLGSIYGGLVHTRDRPVFVLLPQLHHALRFGVGWSREGAVLGLVG